MSRYVKTLSKGEEIGNSITHGVGVALSIAGLVLLVVKASFSHSAVKVASFAIFGVTLILLYSASTLYHAFYINVKSERAKYIFRLFDHSAIYLLIAGTYTPFSLVAIGGRIGWTIFGCVWGIALVGIILNIFFLGRYPVLFTIIYLAMGWLIVTAWKPLVQNMPRGALILLIAGGLVYSFGVVFYALEKMKYSHFVWHFFVLGGSILHFLAVLLYL
ncbi:MAG: PAQR family membrane homeostasis protein TrhA [Caldisericaceae bacterium]